MTLLQMIIGNARAEMVNMMKTNVAREPLQDLGQLVKRTPLKRGQRVIPLLAALPVDSLELVLDIEEPDTCRPGNRDRYQLQKQISFPAKNPTHAARHKEKQKV